ncbi:MAG: PAS domain S-box protein [Cyanobacteria bacterium SBLK]|nr:PAS domain S-box protein [Cyanobacteria bacterium SBLK]
MSDRIIEAIERAIDRSPPIVSPDILLFEAIEPWLQPDKAILTDNYLFVTESGTERSQLLGLLTEREAIAFMADRDDWRKRPVKEAMSSAIAYQTSEIIDLPQLLAFFRQYSLPAVPLIDTGGAIVGAISRQKLWQFMETHLLARGDREIELQQAEAALKASEFRYWEILEAQTELICRFLPDSTLTFVNEAYCRYFHCSKQELIGQKFLTLMPEADRARVQQILQKLTPENPVITEEYQAFRPDGTLAWQQWTDRAIFDRENNLLEYQAVGRDINDRVRAEKALRRGEEQLRQLNETLEAKVRDRTLSLQNSEARFRSLFEQAAIGITLTELTGEHIAANQKFCDLLGYSTSEILQLTWQQITHPEDVPHQRECDRQILAGETQNYSLEKRYLHREGKELWVNLTHSVVCDRSGIPKYNLNIVEDIRDRKEAWQALEENRLRQDLHNRILAYINRGMPVHKTLSYAIEEIGKAFPHLRVIYAALDSEECCQILHQYVPPSLAPIEQLVELCPYVAQLKAKENLLIEDVTQEEPLQETIERSIATETRALLYVPVQYSEQSIGTLGLHSSRPHSWTQQEIALLTEVRDYLTVAIQERNARTELKQQKEFLQAIFDSIPVMLLLFDRHGKQQWANRFWENITGWEREWRDRDILAACYRDPELCRQFRALIQEATLKWQDFRMQVREGMNLDTTWASVCLSDGTTLAIGQDISDRKRAEAEVQAVRERFEYLISSSPAIIYSCRIDESFSATFISENVTEILGYSSRDWLTDANFWTDRLHPEDVSRILLEIEQLFKSGHRTYQYRFLHRDGTYRWLRDSVKLVRDEEGNPVECIGSVIEIGDRKQAEEELRKSEERYRAIVQDQTELICRYRIDGTLLFVNDAYCRYFNCDRQNLMNSQWLPDILPEDLEKLNRQYTLLRPENPVYTCEIRTFLPDGTLGVQQWVDRGFFNDSGELIEIQAVGRDISNLKQAENDIRKALEKERELSELKSNFISIASHEFRTPLTVIMASAKLQKHYSDRLTEEQKQQQLDRLLRASDRILQLLNDILILGRAEAGKIDFLPAPLNLKTFCRQLLAEIQAIDENQHQIVLYEQQDIDRELIADENLLRYILTNLLSNSVKYSPRDTPVILNVMASDREAIFRVEDRGIGIPAEDIPHLFESFHRAKNVGEIKGTGLGLAIVKKAIDIYGGAIAIKSVVNSGTTFTVTLPVPKIEN